MKIRRHKRRSVPTLNMASMPDLIFTVLFFFMIVTHMRTETPKVNLEVPDGKELQKAASKRTITNIYIGTDAKGASRIQIGEKIIPLEQVGAVISNIRSGIGEEDAGNYTVNIRADKHTSMGTITDVKQELRKAGALKIRYSANEDKEEIK